MLISAKRTALQGNHIPVTPWLRAPLFLSEGTLYYSALENQLENPRYAELITTTIDVDHWADMWRIEFETDDKPGNSALLLNLLFDRELTVLNMESSVNAFTTRHTTSILVSARNYTSARDLTSRERLQEDSFQLRELEEDFLIYFWDQIAIDATGIPRLKVRQMHSYRQLYDDVRAGSRFVINRDGQVLTDRGIELSDRAARHLRKFLKTDDLTGTSTVDTKDRTILTTIFSAHRPTIFHFQAVFSASNQELLRWIYSELFRCGGNIVKSQVRPCPSATAIAAARERHDSSELPRIADDRYSRADVTFDFVDSLPAEQTSARLAQFEALFAEVVESSGAFGFIKEKSW